MSVTIPHTIDWTDNGTELASKIEENFQEISRRVIALDPDATVGGILSLSSLSPKATTTTALISKRVITTTGSGVYVPTTGTTYIILELQGGGAGGGGATTGTAGQSALAQAGTGGGYLRKLLTSGFAGATYSVGAKGTGGGAGNNNGNPGSDTTFTLTSGTVYTASGGVAGAAAAANVTGAPPTHRTSANSGGGATNGDVNIPGATCVNAVGVSTSKAFGMTGGNSHLGMGGLAASINALNASSAGSAGRGYGAGGSGGAVLGTGASVAGGDGTDGIIIVWEFA